MQCADCGYISFKHKKDCGSCGRRHKKTSNHSTYLFRNNSFSIFSSTKEQNQSPTFIPQEYEEITPIETSKDSQENQEFKSDDFIINFSDSEQEQSSTTLRLDKSELDTSDFSSIEFSTSFDISLQEREVEELDLGLEPFENEPSTPVITKAESEETQLEISNEPNTIRLRPEETGCKINDLDHSPPTEEVGLKKADGEIEKITPSPSQNLEQNKMDPIAPVLDLGNDEALFDVDEKIRLESAEVETSLSPNQLDNIDIQTEGNVDEILVINDDGIKDLGCELEDSGSSIGKEKPTP